MTKKLEELKKEVSNLELKNVELMWKYANLEWRFIIVLGVLSLIFLLSKLGSYIGKLIW